MNTCPSQARQHYHRSASRNLRRDCKLLFTPAIKSKSSARCKNALSRRPVEERPISAPGSRTTYLGAWSKNDLSRRPVQERPISAPGSRTTYVGARLKNDLSRRRIQERLISNAIFVSLILQWQHYTTLKYGFYRHQTCV